MDATWIRKVIEQCAEPSASGIQTLLESVVDEGMTSLRGLGQRDIDLLGSLLKSCTTRLVFHAGDERPRFVQQGPRLAHPFEHLATESRVLRMLVRSPLPVATRTLTFKRRRRRSILTGVAMTCRAGRNDGVAPLQQREVTALLKGDERARVTGATRLWEVHPVYGAGRIRLGEDPAMRDHGFERRRIATVTGFTTNTRAGVLRQVPVPEVNIPIA